jgi:hypothetical protein
LEPTTRIGNTQDLFEAQVNQMVCKRALPEVVAFLFTKRGPDQAKEDLRDIANIITHRLLLVWTPKKRKPVELIKEMMYVFFGNKKIKGKILERINKKPSKIAIRDYDCPICPDRKGEEVVIKGLHYCVPVSGAMEAVLNYMSERKLVPFTKVKVQTEKSTGSGDPYCEHILTLEYSTRG